ncbi:MAG TPA: histidine phosphatase family protein [Candidatus Obscuribacterales bacterium]
MTYRLKATALFWATGLASAGTTGAIAIDTGAAPPPDAATPINLIAQGAEGGAVELEDQLSGVALRDALQQGGYVIYFRHAQTEQDYADQADPNIDLNDCSTQRALSEYGWRQARVIGEAFEDLAIPVGKVYASQYCRAWQTAAIAFGNYEKSPALNFYPAEEYTDEQFAQMRAAVMPFLTAVPPRGLNTVIVGHDDVFEAATGIYPEPQGVAYVVQPDGNGGFELIANLTPLDWALIPDAD